MGYKGITITEQLKEMINSFLGAELIPDCAIGNELFYIDGNLVLKTFSNGNMHGYRKLGADGELVNIIKELTFR